MFCFFWYSPISKFPSLITVEVPSSREDACHFPAECNQQKHCRLWSYPRFLSCKRTTLEDPCDPVQEDNSTGHLTSSSWPWSHCSELPSGGNRPLALSSFNESIYYNSENYLTSYVKLFVLCFCEWCDMFDLDLCLCVDVTWGLSYMHIIIILKQIILGFISLALGIY